jgi:hypothetical protein
MKQHNYRKELQNRTIKPSSDSWEKLSRNLAAQENKEKGGNWMFFKVASIILIFISVGFYFLKEDENLINPQIIVSPTLKENLNVIPDKNDVFETEIAVTPDISTVKKSPIIDSKMRKSGAGEVVSSQPMNERTISINKDNELAIIDTVTEAILITEILNSEEQFIDDEVQQLLNESKIKLIVNGQISTKKVVDANVLLNSVEEDLYKDLKQKLIDKIASTLKNPKEVVTSRED